VGRRKKNTLTNVSNFQGFASYNPAWSPDATQIAFVSLVSGRANLYLIGVDGSSMQKLTGSSDTEFENPAWQP
jgi:Tol biopolymer transport system component